VFPADGSESSKASLELPQPLAQGRRSDSA
jgi:hypothetical protein